MHDETPDISIVVPVYNTERFLPACLESIDIQGTCSFEVIRSTPMTLFLKAASKRYAM